MNEYNFIKNQNKNLITEYIIEKINSSDSFFLNRIGGSDYDAVYEYYSNNKNLDLFDYKSHYDRVSNLNGYFDKEKDIIIKKKNFADYLDKMLECYLNSSALLNPCQTIQLNLTNRKNDFNKYICQNKTMIHYYYIEAISDFLDDFSIFAKNKKILIISPFSKSIKYQYQYKDFLINNYKYPEFELLTYDTPITYNNENDNLDLIKTNNWIEQCVLMENEIKNIDFDIALLSCASYANYLGNSISCKFNKKAIYIGGVLNILFNIKGERFANSKFYNDINNLSYQIVALEKEKYENIKGGRLYKSEALNAYF